MRVKVIFYSLDGNSKLIAEEVAKSLNGDIVELKPKKYYANSGFKKYLWGGTSVLMKEKPELEAYDNNLDYDLLVIGTPVWAGTFSPAIRTFLKENNLDGRKVALFACHAGGGADKCFEKFKKFSHNCKVISTMDFVDPLKKDTANNIDKAVKWAKSL